MVEGIGGIVKEGWIDGWMDGWERTADGSWWTGRWTEGNIWVDFGYTCICIGLYVSNHLCSAF